MQNMMKQAQKLQKQMEKSQAELAATTFTGKSAQDLVVAELTGDKKVVNITFADAVVDFAGNARYLPDDVFKLTQTARRLETVIDFFLGRSHGGCIKRANGLNSLLQQFHGSSVNGG